MGFTGGQSEQANFDTHNWQNDIFICISTVFDQHCQTVDKKPELRAYTLAPFAAPLEWKKEAHFTRQVLPFVRFL